MRPVGKLSHCRCIMTKLGSEWVGEPVYSRPKFWFRDTDRVELLIITRCAFFLGIPVVQPFLYQPLTGQIVQPSVIRGRVYVPSTSASSDSSYHMRRQEMVRLRIPFQSPGNYALTLRNCELILTGYKRIIVGRYWKFVIGVISGHIISVTGNASVRWQERRQWV